MFLSPRRESNPQSFDLRWDALTIELPGLRWQREGHDVYRFVPHKNKFEIYKNMLGIYTNKFENSKYKGPKYEN